MKWEISGKEWWLLLLWDQGLSVRYLDFNLSSAFQLWLWEYPLISQVGWFSTMLGKLSSVARLWDDVHGILVRIWPSSSSLPSQASSDMLELRVTYVNTNLHPKSRSWDDLVETFSVFASRLQGGQKSMGMRFQSTWPSCLPTGFGFLPSCAGVEAGQVFLL